MSCSKTTHNLYWVAGNTETLDLRMLDEDLNIEDITGSDAVIGLKLQLSDATKAIESVGTVDGPSGRIEITISQTETSNLLPANKNKIAYFYAVELTDSNGHSSTVLEGRVFVSRSVFS